MASTSNDTKTLKEPYWSMAKAGIKLVINNQSQEALELFKKNSDNITMSAGYSFVTFMDALMCFEEEKLQEAFVALKETEKKCATDIGWIKSVKSRFIGKKNDCLAETLENQIILADTQMYVAILTFLQQELAGYIKGGWIMRKAWKVYQQTYIELMNLYKEIIGALNLPDPTEIEWNDIGPELETAGCTDDWALPSTSLRTETARSPEPKNGYIPKSKLPQSHSSYVLEKSSISLLNMKRSGSVQSTLSKDTMNSSKSTFSFLSPISDQLSYFSNSLNLLMDRNSAKTIDPSTVSRLMGAVCFGYGVLQLGVSLLPPSLLKLSSYFGFQGNRDAGISNLMYARKGSDMRAPLAMLALLWYHTIIRPFYALDGTNVKAGVAAARILIQEIEPEYAQSALILYFKGRIHRLNSNIPLALENFQASMNNSSQQELVLLSLYEIGWCHLIKLDYERAESTFQQLKTSSRWSKSFYNYIIIICQKAHGHLIEYNVLRKIAEAYTLQTPRATQLEIFLQRRLRVFPNTKESLENKTVTYWAFFIYEMLYLWNSLPSCSNEVLNKIIADCNVQDEEPMPGLAKLIQGECYTIQHSQNNAIDSLRMCMARRTNVTRDDVHISVFAEFTLGDILTKNPQTLEEGKQLIQHASHYKDYDFDSKMHARIELALKLIQ